MTIGVVSLTVSIDWKRCATCDYLHSSGRHDSVEACSRGMGHECKHPEEHHRFRRKWLPHVTLKASGW